LLKTGAVVWRKKKDNKWAGDNRIEGRRYGWVKTMEKFRFWGGTCGGGRQVTAAN